MKYRYNDISDSMKRIILILFTLFLSGCSIKLDHVDNKVDINRVKEEKDPIPLEPIEEYKDENPVQITLYTEDNLGVLNKASREMQLPWEMKKDIIVFGSLFCTDDKKDADYFQNIWKACADAYEDSTKYKVGWQVSFSLTDGSKITQIINKPSDVEYFYDYLEIYLYDSANVPINTWYSHLLDDQMNENTIMTSIKLTAGSKYQEIDGPIEVKVFTYDSEDDFLEDGSYRGQSFYEVTIYND